MRGIGWVVLYQEPRSGKLINAWINEHDVGHLAGARPLLVMDVFEHAYMPDYQLDRAKYIEAFFKNINWQAVDRRFNK
jgi:Fe-Mn family superoxide dismutase